MTAEQVRLIEAWIRALRSGDYNQVHGHLRRIGDEIERGGWSEKKCCCALGVLADVAIKSGLPYEWVPKGGTAHVRRINVSAPGHTETFMKEVIGDFIHFDTVVEWNDEIEYPFGEIAELLEDRLESDKRHGGFNVPD